MYIFLLQISIIYCMICIVKLRSVGQEVKTPPSHGGITGSSPVQTATVYIHYEQPNPKRSLCVFAHRLLFSLNDNLPKIRNSLHEVTYFLLTLFSLYRHRTLYSIILVSIKDPYKYHYRDPCLLFSLGSTFYNYFF